MNRDQLGEIISSRVRLKIADALSQRPRTLGELAYLTGISVQGVLRHLRLLEGLGVVEERKVSANAPKARRVYAAKGRAVGDFSHGDLTVAKAVDKLNQNRPPRPGSDLEGMSAEVLIRRMRVKEEAKRLGRLIDELAEGQEELRSALDRMPLSEDERLILEVVLTEDTLEDGVRALSKFYGMEDRRSIDKALAKAKRNVGK